MNVMTVIQQVGMLSVVMALGFIVVKTGYVEAKVKDAISKLIVKLILPCLIISSISAKDFETELLGDMAIVFGLSVFSILTLFFLGVLTAKLFKIPQATQTVHKMLSSVGNVIFIGYPILIAMYGDMGFFYAITYWLLNDLFLWTVGVILFSKENPENRGAFWKKLLNPNTISFAVAIFMFVLGIKLPPIVDTALTGVGALTTHLSMIFIGMALATVDVKAAVKKWWIFVMAPLKLVIMPMIFILLFRSLGIKEILFGVVVLEAAMPAQTVLTILANEYGSDYEYAAVAMFITTIASMFTLPLVCYLLNIWA